MGRRACCVDTTPGMLRGVDGSTGTDRIVGRQRELDALRAWLERSPRRVRPAGPVRRRAGDRQDPAGPGARGSGARRAAPPWRGDVASRPRGRPRYWPWRQVLRSLGVDPDACSPATSSRPRTGSGSSTTWPRRCGAWPSRAAWWSSSTTSTAADEPSLLVLRHLADQVDRLASCSVFADVPRRRAREPAAPGAARPAAVAGGRAPRPAWLRPRRGARAAGADDRRRRPTPTLVLEVTGGNPLFVREVARAMADGACGGRTGRRAPCSRSSGPGSTASRPDCRRLVQAAAVVGRDFSLALVAAALDEPVGALPAARRRGDRVRPGRASVGDAGDYRFVHALTRDAVEASLTTADRAGLHRRVAEAIEARFAGDLSEHLVDLARHWAELAPYGEGTTARRWTIRAAEEAVARLAYEEGVRLYRAALALEAPAAPAAERCRVQIALGRAAYLAGDLPGCVEAAVAAADAAARRGEPGARGRGRPRPGGGSRRGRQRRREAAVREGARRARRRRVGGPAGPAARPAQPPGVLRRRAGARRAAERGGARPGPHVGGRPRAGRRAARPAGGVPGTGRPGRAAAARRPRCSRWRSARDSARTAMWGELWRIDALIESGQLAGAAEELGALRVAVERVGGPVSAWHLDRVTAMPRPGAGPLRRGRGGRPPGVRADARRSSRPRPPGRTSPCSARWPATSASPTRPRRCSSPFDPPPRFRVIDRLTRALLLLRAGRTDEAAASYQQAGPLETWSLPAFFVLPGHVYATLVAAELGLTDDLAVLARPARARFAASTRSATASPTSVRSSSLSAARRWPSADLDAGVDDLAVAAEQAARAGAPGFVAEARYHLANALLARGGPGDRERARRAARESARLVGRTGQSPSTPSRCGPARAARPPARRPR